MDQGSNFLDEISLIDLPFCIEGSSGKFHL